MYSRACLPRWFFGFCLATCLMTNPAQAGPVFQIASGNLTLSAELATLSGGGCCQLTFDVRGAVLETVSDVALPPTSIAILDSTGGTDPTFSTLAFGNSALLAADSNTTSTGIEDIVFFSFGNFIANTLTVPATAAVFPVSSTPGPALADMIANSPLSFQFNNETVQGIQSNGALLIQWQLAGITPATAAPEPMSSLLLGSGVLAILGFQFRRIRKRAR